MSSWMTRFIGHLMMTHNWIWEPAMAQELDSQLKALKYKTRVWHSLKMVKNVLGALWYLHTQSSVRSGIRYGWPKKTGRGLGSASSDGRAEECLWVTRVRQYSSGCGETWCDGDGDGIELMWSLPFCTFRRAIVSKHNWRAISSGSGSGIELWKWDSTLHH